MTREVFLGEACRHKDHFEFPQDGSPEVSLILAESWWSVGSIVLATVTGKASHIMYISRTLVCDVRVVTVHVKLRELKCHTTPFAS